MKVQHNYRVRICPNCGLYRITAASDIGIPECEECSINESVAMYDACVLLTHEEISEKLELEDYRP